MCKLAISLLEMNYQNLKKDIKIAERAGIDMIHVDVMDGMFVPNFGIGIHLIQSIRPLTNLCFDVHMMVTEPGRFVSQLAKAGANVLIVHFEACEHLNEILLDIQRNDMKCGIALCPETPWEVLQPDQIEKANVIHIMTTKPGVEKQAFIPETLHKIRSLKEYIDRHELKCEIEVDGNISTENEMSVINAGASILVSGRGLTYGNMSKNIISMKQLFHTVESKKGNEENELYNRN